MILPECKNTDPNVNTLVIHLTEDVSVDSILINNEEEFSSSLKEIQFFGSNIYPPSNDKWINMGFLHPGDGN